MIKNNTAASKIQTDATIIVTGQIKLSDSALGSATTLAEFVGSRFNNISKSSNGAFISSVPPFTCAWIVIYKSSNSVAADASSGRSGFGSIETLSTTEPAQMPTTFILSRDMLSCFAIFWRKVISPSSE